MSKRTLLTVEDEDLLREGIARLFQEKGWSVMEASTAKDGLEQFKNNPVDVVLTDLLLPDMDGTVLLEAVRQIDPHVATVVLTGYGTLKRAVTALRAGASDFVAKPFENSALVEAVEKAWRQSIGRPIQAPALDAVTRIRLELRADPNVITDAVERIDALARVCGYHGKRWAIRRAMQEALDNAITHGARGNGTIVVEASFDNECASISVTDPGPGFDHDAHSEQGGVFLIRSFADKASWSSPGNHVEILFYPS